MIRLLIVLFVLSTQAGPSWPLLKEPKSVAAGNGFIYILDGKQPTWLMRLKKYDSNGTYVSTLNEKITHFDESVFLLSGKDMNRNEIIEKYGDILNYLKVEPEPRAILDRFFFPDKIAFAPDGEIYGVGLLSYGKDRRRAGIINAGDGHTIRTFGESTEDDKPYGLWEPLGVAADSQGNMYVANQRPYFVKKFDKDGRFIAQWGKRGGGDGEFERPAGIAVDTRNDDIYVVDCYSSWDRSPQMRVQKFTKDGKFLKKWGDHFGVDWRPLGWLPVFYPNLTNIPDLDAPAGIAVDGKGAVYLVEKGKRRINKYDSDGKLLLSFGGERGKLPGQFNMDPVEGVPVGIAVDEMNNVYVCDQDNDRVQKFDENGKFLMEIK